MPGGQPVAPRWAQVRDLLRELVVRDIRLRYRGSLLGVAWTLLNPLAELLVLFFVFGIVFQTDIPNFPAFLFTGLLVYGWFQISVNAATAAIVGNRELIRRQGVPSSVLPVVTVASNLVHFLLSLPVLFGLLLLSHVRITPTVLVLPVLIAIEFVLILCLAFPAAALHVWFRDTQYVLRVALQLLFYVTPIFYSVRTIPPRFQHIYYLNPMVTVVEAYRAVLIDGRLPRPGPLLAVAAISSLLLAVGVWAFQRASYRFADEL